MKFIKNITAHPLVKRYGVLSLLLIILVIALGNRIIWVQHVEAVNTPIGFDGIRYDWIATNLLNGEGFGYHPGEPDSWRPPGYPFFLYAMYSLFGRSIYLIRILQCFFATATCLIVFLLSRKITKDSPYSQTISLLAAFLYAVNFYSTIIVMVLFTELFNSFLIILAIYLFYLAQENRRRKFYLFAILASLTLWYSALTRPANILFWFWVGLWFILKNRTDTKRVLMGFAIAVATFCIIVLPWTIRNYHLHKKFLLISSNGGFIFFLAHHPESKGDFVRDESIRYTPQQKAGLEGLDTIDGQKKHFQYALEWIRNNPKRELELIFLKQRHLWFKQEYSYLAFEYLPGWKFPLLTFHFYLFFAVPGLIFVFRNIKKTFLLVAYIINHSMIISLFYFYDSMRMRTVLLPMLVIFAAIGAVYLSIKLYELVQLIFSRTKTNF